MLARKCVRHLCGMPFKEVSGILKVCSIGCDWVSYVCNTMTGTNIDFWQFCIVSSQIILFACYNCEDISVSYMTMAHV